MTAHMAIETTCTRLLGIKTKKKWKKDLNAETENTPTNDGRRLEVAEVEAWLVQ